MSMPDTAHKTINAETAETAEPTGFSARSASSALNVRELTFGEAVKEAIAEEMRRDDRVVVFGEDVAEAGTAFKVLAGPAPEIRAPPHLGTPDSPTWGSRPRPRPPVARLGAAPGHTVLGLPTAGGGSPRQPAGE